MNVRQAVDGFLLFKSGEGLSPNTLNDYGHWLKLFARRFGDEQVHDLRPQDFSAFLDFLRTEHRPSRWNGDDSPLASSTIRNAWVALKSFSRWSAATLDVPDQMGGGKVPMPKATNAERAPLTQDEVKAILASLNPKRAKRPLSGRYYLDDLRDRALILTLLDTGIRAAELCDLKIGDLHVPSGRLAVAGKGGKHRHVFMGGVTRPAVWQYLQERNDGGDPAVPLFMTSYGRPFNRDALRKRTVNIGLAAGVPDCYPHRLRYTFAIQYLRNGGDVFTLQSLLGHTTMTMVQHYLKLAAADVEDAHRRASPVDRWLK